MRFLSVWINVFALALSVFWAQEVFAGSQKLQRSVANQTDSIKMISSSRLRNPISSKPAWYTDPQALKVSKKQRSHLAVQAVSEDSLAQSIRHNSRLQH